MQNILTKATVEGVRIYALCTTKLVNELAGRHKCSHLASAALGRAMNGALLLAATMKDNERITLRLKGDGPIGEVVADAEGNCVRGYVENNDVFLPLKDGKLDIGGAIGNGNIIVTRYLQNAEPFTGYCELQDGEIASDLTKYLCAVFRILPESSPAARHIPAFAGCTPPGYFSAAQHIFPRGFPSLQAPYPRHAYPTYRPCTRPRRRRLPEPRSESDISKQIFCSNLSLLSDKIE